MSGTLLYFCIFFAFGVLFCSSVFSFPAQAGPQNYCSRLVKTCVALLEACLRKNNKVPEKNNFIAQRCAPVCLRKIQFRKKRTLFAYAVRPCVSGKHSSAKKLYSPTLARVCQEIQFPEKKNSPTLCARVSQENKVPEKRALFAKFRKKSSGKKNLFANAVCPCVSGKQSREKNFIRQRCAPVCLGKIYFRKNTTSIRQRCALVCLRQKIRNKRALLPNAALPGVSDKYSCGKTYSPTLAQENQVPAKFIRQCCAPACLRKIKFRENRTLFANAARPRVSGKYSSGRKELYSPTLRAHVSRVPENNCIRQRCAPECENNFIRQRCAPVCLRKRKFRKTRVSQNVVPEKMEPQEAN